MIIQTKAIITFTQEDIINALITYAESKGFEAINQDVLAQDIPEELVLVVMSKPEELTDAHSNKSGTISAPSEAKVTELISDYLSRAPQEPVAQGALLSDGSEPSTQASKQKRMSSIFDDDIEDVPTPKKMTANLFA